METNEFAGKIDVSVVLAVKNESLHIDEALGSIAAQKGGNFEVLVVDDGSTDDTASKIESWASKQKNICYLRNPGMGKVSAFNFGIGQAEGRFVCLFAGDDIMPEGSLFDRFSVVRDYVDSKPVTGLYKIRTLSKDPRYDGQVVPKKKGRGNPSGQSPLMNRKMVDRIFPVPENLPNEDTWMELAVTHMSGLTIAHSDLICCLWRVHEGNSYNMKMGFEVYKAALVNRLRAYKLFHAKFGSELSENARRTLLAQIKCNEHYEKGNVLGVIFSPAPLLYRLRFLASTNAFFFNLRSRFFKIFSGW